VRGHAIAFVVCAITGASRLAAATPTAAQQPPARPPAEKPAPRAGGPPATAMPADPDNFTYEPRGRRDPFVNLLGTGDEPRLSSRRGEGAAGWTVSEISVRGIVESRGTFVGLVQGPDNKTFVMHAGDRFLDGTIKTITPQGLVIVQEVSDPLSPVKQREIRKQLRTFEDAQP
jgi:Tfp pilus assembly protein PilP